MKLLLIGVASVGYNEEGQVEFANFLPEMQIDLDQRSLNNLKKVVNNSTNTETVKENADKVLAHWFSKINDIELAERPQFQVTSEIVNCEKHANGNVKLCVIRYSFSEFKELKSCQKPELN
jgi:hypothetical protein